jgi:hypothetical protein
VLVGVGVRRTGIVGVCVGVGVLVGVGVGRTGIVGVCVGVGVGLIGVLVGVGVGRTGMVGVCVGVGVGLIGITGVGVGLIGAVLSINMEKPYSSPTLASGTIRISKKYSIPSRGVKLNITNLSLETSLAITLPSASTILTSIYSSGISIRYTSVQ